MEIPQTFPTVQIDDSISFISNGCDLQIHCVVDFKGQLDAERLARAVRLSVDAEPILGCCLKKHWWRQSWERRADLDRVKLFELVEAEQARAEVMVFLASPLDLYNGPLVQVRLYRSSSDTLCVKVNHIVADAGGVKEYVELLASIYNRLGESAYFRPTPNVKGSRSIQQVTRQFSSRQRLKHLGQMFQAYIWISRPSCQECKIQKPQGLASWPE